MAKHERVEMKRIGVTAKQYNFRLSFLRTNSFRSENVWFYVVECPTCGLIKRPLVNPNRGKTFYCSG